MTIEAKIEALIVALNDNTGALLGRPKVTGSNAAQTAKAAPENIKVAEKAAGISKTPTYDDVKGPFLALVRKNRDTALAAIAPLNNLKEAAPEEYSAILARVAKALADAEAAA